MFTRARLHLTLLYAALLSVTVVLIAGAIGYFAVQEARRTDDRELSLRAAAIAAAVPQNPPNYSSGPPPPPPDGDRGGRPPPLEQRGLLEYTLHCDGGQVIAPQQTALPGLPDLPAAQQARDAGKGLYASLDVQGSQVRLYSLPVVRGGQTVSVVQVARSAYFVNAAVTRLALIALAAGAAGLVLSGGAGYWLAGRTLRPIANALDRQRNFAADASHELRTPLTVLLTNAELLTRHPERQLAEYQDVVEDIIVETERLGRLVSDLLTLARADQGKTKLELAPVDLSEIGASVARQFAPIGEGKGVAVRAEISPNVTVTGDYDRLYQLGVILVDNAVRYTDQGSVTVRVAQQHANGVLSVTDTGHGIAAEHLPHLFERFYRTDSARNSEEGGTGLGLSIAQWIVESHHGEIEVESTPGKGSTFTVRLPARSSGDRPQQRKPEPVAMIDGRDG